MLLTITFFILQSSPYSLNLLSSPSNLYNHKPSLQTFPLFYQPTNHQSATLQSFIHLFSFYHSTTQLQPIASQDSSPHQHKMNTTQMVRNNNSTENALPGSFITPSPAAVFSSTVLPRPSEFIRQVITSSIDHAIMDMSVDDGTADTLDDIERSIRYSIAASRIGAWFESPTTLSSSLPITPSQQSSTFTTDPPILFYDEDGNVYTTFLVERCATMQTTDFIDIYPDRQHASDTLHSDSSWPITVEIVESEYLGSFTTSSDDGMRHYARPIHSLGNILTRACRRIFGRQTALGSRSVSRCSWSEADEGRSQMRCPRFSRRGRGVNGDRVGTRRLLTRFLGCFD